MYSLAVVVLLWWHCNAIIEPYPPLHGGNYRNNSYLSKYSPDPIINYIWDLNTVNRSELQIYNVTPKHAYTDHEGSFYNLQSIYLTPNDINVIVYGPGSITLDFGFENAAWFEIDSNDCTDNGLTMSISEYNQPGNTLNPHYPKTLKPVKYTNNGITTYRLETNKALYDGVRYGFIHVSNETNNPWHIIGIRVVAQIKPLNYIGSFQSNEYPMLNYIWYAAAYCVKMNMLPGGMGSILMDRGDRIAFMGDDHISLKVAMYAFGEYNYVKQNIIMTQKDTDNILSYPLYWIQSIYDYYLLTNDTSLLTAMLPEITYYLNQSIAAFYQASPAINFYGWDERIGAGFEGANKSPEAQYAYKMLSTQTIGKSLTFFDKNALNNSGLYDYYAAKRTEFIKIIRNNSNYLNEYGLHSSSDAINGLWMTENETNYLFSKWFNDSVNICSWSPFNMFYIMTAIGNLQHMDYLLSALDLCWGTQIRLGATTFWEEFSPQWYDFLLPNEPIPNAFGMTSECHPWSSGSLSIINEFIVGVQIIKPGFEYIRIKPALLNIRATVPVSGNKSILVDIDGLNGKYIINIPIVMEMDIYFPVKSFIKKPMIYMNDMECKKSFKMVSSKSQKYIMMHFNKNELPLNTANYFEISVSLHENVITSGADIPNVFPPPSYPCSVVDKDFETKGNWINTYGKAGYILFAYDSSNNNLSKLPKWVTSVKTVGASVLRNWIDTTSDIRALQNPNKANERALGAVYSNHTANQPPSFALNITVDETLINNSTYYMSIYLCDWSDDNRKQTIHVFDALNLNIITPIVYDEDYVNGVWITFKLDRSVRIRINVVRGPTGVLSGIFFDLSVPKPDLLK